MDMRKLMFMILGVCAVIRVSAQQRGTISGTLCDSENGEPMIGAIVEITTPSDPDYRKNVLTDVDGTFSFSSVPYGDYKLEATYMGYQDFKMDINVRGNVDLEKLKMIQEAQKIDDVVVSGISMRSATQGDTLIYNAGAFKVTKDADAEDLLGKMPGVTVTDGKVEAQGEEVKKVFVDGKEFFGSDVTSAIKNLPAEAIDQVEVFNKLSDQAQFSGIDDGEGYKAINIVTRPSMRTGVFGKISGTYGFNDKYSAGLSLNIFNKDGSRISITGLANNINQQNFSSEDILGISNNSGQGSQRRGMGGGSFGGGGGRQNRGGSGTSNFMTGNNQKGISTIRSLGVNYTDQWGEKVKFDGSYFFNMNKNNVYTLTDRQYYTGSDSTQLYDANSTDSSTNYNHRINLKLDYDINDNNKLMIRPSLSFQSNQSVSTDTSTMSLYTVSAAQSLLNDLKGMTSADNTGYNISNTIVYMHKFGKVGRTLTMMLDGNVSKNDKDSYEYSLTRYYDPLTESLLEQDIQDRSFSYRINGNLTYSEPLSAKTQLLMNYNISYNYSDRDKQSYELPEYQFLDSLSNTYNSGYLTQRFGPGFRFYNPKGMFVANIYYQTSTLAGNQTYPAVANPKISANFNNIIYSAIFNYKFNPNNTLRMRLRSSTNNPSVTQLQDVLDLSNPLFVSQGNPFLRPVYSHNFSATYVRANVGKGRTFMAMVGGTMQNNYIGNAVQIADVNGYEVKDESGNTITILNKGAQYSKPVNMNGYWSINGMVSYGFPVQLIKSNLNVNLRTTYYALPSLLNGLCTTTNTVSYTGGVVLGSNISDRIDFTFSYNVGYNRARNVDRPTADNDYVNQVATGKFKWVAWGGITLQANASYTKYNGITDNFREEYMIVNASIGKKLFKNQRGELSVGINDIFNQNKSFARNVTDNYIENVTSNVLRRYVNISFVYNLRTMGGDSRPKNPFLQ